MLTRMSKLSPVFSVCLHGLKGRLLVPYKRPPQNVNPLRDYPAHPLAARWPFAPRLRQ